MDGAQGWGHIGKQKVTQWFEGGIGWREHLSSVRASFPPFVEAFSLGPIPEQSGPKRARSCNAQNGASSVALGRKDACPSKRKLNAPCDIQLMEKARYGQAGLHAQRMAPSFAVETNMQSAYT